MSKYLQHFKRRTQENPESGEGLLGLGLCYACAAKLLPARLVDDLVRSVDAKTARLFQKKVVRACRKCAVSAVEVMKVFGKRHDPRRFKIGGNTCEAWGKEEAAKIDLYSE